MKLSHTVGLLPNAYGGDAGVEDQGAVGSGNGAFRRCRAQWDQALCLGVHASTADFGFACSLIGAAVGPLPSN
jgi:hypothetical protein